MQTPIHGPFAPPHPAGLTLQNRLAAEPSPVPPPPAALERAHHMLYGCVPSFACEPGCTECCRVVPMSAWEWDGVQDKRQAAASCSKCPYAAGGKCDIHARRPLLCRLFGSVDHPSLICPKGRGPHQKLSAAYADQLMRAYQRLLVDAAP